MIKQTSLNFLKNLKENNSKEWFENNRISYQEYKDDIIQFAENILHRLIKIDPAISITNLEAKKCLTRVNRDLRFSKDKTPYKNYVLMVFNKNGFHGNTAGYFIHIEPENCMVGGGIWQTTPEILKRIHKEIDYSFKDISKIITSQKFQKTFPKGLQGVGILKKLPNAYDENNPASELLKMKGFCTRESINDKLITGENSIQTVIDYFKTTKPLIDYLNTAIEFDE